MGPRAHAAGTSEATPSDWVFSGPRIAALFRHFEGRWPREASARSGSCGRRSGWPEHRGLYASAVRALPNPAEYGRRKARWKRFTGAMLAEVVLQFLRDIEGLAAPNEFEPDFFYRMQWLPYVGQAAHGGVKL